ncbi:MAG: outer membrane beta-barrel protein [Ignavibacterium sp.]|nr:MAG: outer membrane beta-barrel protein [Ignavibacterium sp.]
MHIPSENTDKLLDSNKSFLKVILLITVLICSGNLSRIIAQPGYGTNVSGVLAVPIGKNSGIYNTGFGALAGFYYDLDKKFRIELKLGYITLGLDGEEFNKKLQEANAGSSSLTGSSNAIPVIVSFQLITPGSGTRFYGLIEAGIYTYWSRAKGTYFPGDGEVPIDRSEFRSEAGFSVGGGALFPLSEELNLDVNIRYTFVQDSEYLNLGNTTLSHSQVLLFGVGINWFFPL